MAEIKWNLGSPNGMTWDHASLLMKALPMAMKRFSQLWTDESPIFWHDDLHRFCHIDGSDYEAHPADMVSVDWVAVGKYDEKQI